MSEMIYEAMLKVMDEVQSVGKTGRNSAQGYSFRGVDAVVNAVGPALRKHGVIVLPEVLSMNHRDFTTEKGKIQHEAILEIRYTFYASDGSSVVCSAPGEASDFSDKATTQAMSVAYRTALIQALCLPTDSPDPDESSVVRGQEPWVALGWQSKEQRDEAWADNVSLMQEIPAGPGLEAVKAWGKAQGLDPDTITADQSIEWLRRIGEATKTGKALEEVGANLTFPEGEEPF